MERSDYSEEPLEESAHESNRKVRLSFAIDNKDDLMSSSISIKEHQFQEDTLSKKIVYTIQGSDSKGQFQATRRYNEFFILRSILVDRWPGFYVPKIPAKQKIGNMESSFIEKRQKLLDLFLKKIKNLEYIYMSHEFQCFIRDQQDFKTIAKGLPKNDGKSMENIISAFPRFINQSLNTDAEEKFIESEAIFRASVEALNGFRDQCSILVSNFDVYESVLIDFIGELKELGSVYTSKTYEGGNRESFFNPYVILLDWATAEILDLEAILEAIEGRKRFFGMIGGLESRLEGLKKTLLKSQSGKKSLSQFFTKKSKEEIEAKAQADVESLQIVIKNAHSCYKIITIRLASKEIEMFKMAKLETYKHIMKIFATASIQELTILVQQVQSLEFFSDFS